mmetsp:Transcript_5274/g.16962  ORF Transcript_5274/g.16962 Transcript_5274/m.16962 type:complete len:370 (-) Transcript_5274:222-1331(-)
MSTSGVARRLVGRSASSCPSSRRCRTVEPNEVRAARLMEPPAAHRMEMAATRRAHDVVASSVITVARTDNTCSSESSVAPAVASTAAATTVSMASASRATVARSTRTGEWSIMWSYAATSSTSASTGPAMSGGPSSSGLGSAASRSVDRTRRGRSACSSRRRRAVRTLASPGPRGTSPARTWSARSARSCECATRESGNGENQSMPQRETVAGVACARSSTSKRMRTVGGRASRSPLGRVSTRLSSSSEFIDSTHTGSTSPSKMSQWRTGVVSSSAARSMMARSAAVKRPSVHSRVVASRTPKSSSLRTALGSKTRVTDVVPSIASMADSRVRRTAVLPLPAGPTSITPCDTAVTWYSCSHLCKKSAEG